MHARTFFLNYTNFALPGFGDADVTAASTHFRASTPVPALEAIMDWILSHPQPAVASGAFPPSATSSFPEGPQEGDHKAGTLIRITNFGCVYSTHDEFIDSLAVRDAAGFKRGQTGSPSADGTNGIVISSILRSEVRGGCAYAIRMDQSERIFIIGVEGFEFVQSGPIPVQTPAPAQAPIPGISDYEFFPIEPSAVAQMQSHFALPRAEIDVNGVIPPVDGIRPHIPTVAKAFRERFRSCPNPSSFKKELQHLWNILFRSPTDASRRPQLAMVHGAAFEFAINELLLACEESRYMEPVPAEESKVLAPLEFLKRDPGFLAFVTNQIGLAAPVSSVRLCARVC